MKIVKRGNKIFLRHWLKWWVMDGDQQAFLAVDMMMPIFHDQKPTNNEKQG